MEIPDAVLVAALRVQQANPDLPLDAVVRATAAVLCLDPMPDPLERGIANVAFAFTPTGLSRLAVGRR